LSLLSLNPSRLLRIGVAFAISYGINVLGLHGQAIPALTAIGDQTTKEDTNAVLVQGSSVQFEISFFPSTQDWSGTAEAVNI
jgi:hypothetical protein